MNTIKRIINVFTTLIIVVGGVFLILYLFHIKPYIVLSGSMEPTIKTGSLCFINYNVKYSSIKENDIIAYKLNSGTLVTHRVINKTTNGFETKGDNSSEKDSIITTNNNYLGKNIFWIPYIGYIFKAFQTTNGKIIYIVLLLVLLIIGILYGDKSNKQIKKLQ